MKIVPGQFKGIDLLPGEYEINLDPKATPVQLPARNVPGALKEPLEKGIQLNDEDGYNFPCHTGNRVGV